MRPITTHATRTAPIPRPMTQPRVAVPEKAPSQPYTDCSPESRVGRYGVALAFSKANVQRSRAASRAEFGKGGCGGWKRQQRMRHPRRQLYARRRLTGAPHWINRQLAGYAARRFGAGLTASGSKDNQGLGTSRGLARLAVSCHQPRMSDNNTMYPYTLTILPSEKRARHFDWAIRKHGKLLSNARIGSSFRTGRPRQRRGGA